MNHLYQVLNDEYRNVKVLGTLDEALHYIDVLKETFNENFYIVELKIVYQS